MHLDTPGPTTILVVRRSRNMLCRTVRPTDVLTEASRYTTSWDEKNLSYYISLRYILISSSHPSLSSLNCTFSPDLPTKILYPYISSLVLHSPHISTSTTSFCNWKSLISCFFYWADVDLRPPNIRNKNIAHLVHYETYHNNFFETDLQGHDIFHWKKKISLTKRPGHTICLYVQRLHFAHTARKQLLLLNLLKPTGHVMHQQFNIQQLYVLTTLYLRVLYLSENKRRLVPLTA